MLIKLLTIILILALFRFLVRLVRAVLGATRSDPRIHPGRSAGENPTRGQRIVDVEFTEEKDDASERKGSR
jgi:hypothetical protein